MDQVSVSTPFKAKSRPFQPVGVVFGRVHAVNGKLLDITIPRLSGDGVYEGIEYLSSGFDTEPVPGEGVMVSFIEGRRDDIVVIGRLRSAMPFWQVGITDPQPGELLQWDGSQWVNNVLPSNEPMGFPNAGDSTIAFVNGTRTFTITPVGDSFDVWCKGIRFTKTAAETVVITATAGAHFVYYDADGALTTSTSAFDLENQAPVAYLYWNTDDNAAYFFADERHGVTLDWQTHEYLHRTRGAAYASGFTAYDYTTSGTGALDADAKIDISNGVFFDEDIEISISHSATPTANWEQFLQGGAKIPVFYRSGTQWKLDAATSFPVKQGAARVTYNLNSSGTWTSPDIDNSKFGVYWIIATDNIGNPIISVQGQAQYTSQGSAEETLWGNMDLTGLPIYEFRVLYKLVFQTATGYANTPHARLVSVVDYRTSLTAAGGIPATPPTDHGLLTGLADDDHTQYVLVSGTRSMTALTVTGDTTLNGSLTVNGTTTTVNSTTLTVDDVIVTLGGDTAPVADDNKDRGVEFRYHTGSAAKLGFFGFDDSTGKFTFIPDATNTSEVFSGTKGTVDAYLEWADVLNKPDPVVTVTLTGDVTGSANATLTDLGSGTISVATTIAADSIALGTDTTGNYVATIAGTTNQVSVSGSGSESAAVTLSLPQDIHTAATPTFGRLTLSQATGTAPLTITSTTVVSNLNADLLDGQHGSYYNDAGNLTGTVGSARISGAYTGITGLGTLTSLTVSGDLVVDTSTLAVDSTNNRVGIGTASPGTALDVLGTATVRAAATQDGVALAGRAGGTSSYEVTLTPTTLTADRILTLPNVAGTVVTTGNLSDITSTGTLSSLTVTGDLLVDTTTLKVDSTNNRVGVNTASPATALDVIGTATVRTAAAQDGVALAGRAGGTGTYESTITPTTLSADQTFTLPNASGTAITTGNLTDITSTGTLTALTVSGTLNTTSTVQRSGTTARMLVDAQSIRASGQITTTTTDTTVTGATVTLSLVTGDVVTIVGVFDVQAGSGTFIGQLYAGGAAQTGQVLFVGSTGRFTLSQTWVYSAGSTGSVTFELKAAHTSGSTAFTVRATHTTMLISVFR